MIQIQSTNKILLAVFSLFTLQLTAQIPTNNPSTSKVIILVQTEADLHQVATVFGQEQNKMATTYVQNKISTTEDSSFDELLKDIKATYLTEQAEVDDLDFCEEKLVEWYFDEKGKKRLNKQSQSPKTPKSDRAPQQ